MEEKSINRKKMPYKNRKHFSDYDIVYLQVDDVNDNSSNSANDSAESLNEQIQDEARNKLDLHDFNSEDIFRKTRSDSNLSLPPRPKSANQSQRRSSSQIDITQTQTYKNIYADNLRQYSFLLAKQLGTSNKSPDQLRKSYLKSRKKEVERRERANTGSEPSSRKTSQCDLSSPTRKLSNASNISSSSLESLQSLQSSKYTSSLTDITNLSQEKVDFRRPTTVIRRKKKNKIDSHKRLSAPLLNSKIVIDIEREIQKERKISLPAYASEEQQHRRTTLSLSVPDLSDGMTDHHKERKLSEETVRRQEEAKERLQWRISRLNSFEGILSQAGNLIKDYKRKKSSVTTPLNIDNNNTENTEVTEKIKIENNNNNNADVSPDSALITKQS